jgi:hypothetical protein
MFQITEDPSSGSLLQCLAKNYKNDSIVSFDMDKDGVMAAYSDPLCVCVVSSYTVNYTHAQQVRICCHNTDFDRQTDRQTDGRTDGRTDR